VRFLESETHLGWDPDRTRLELFLSAVMRNVFVDHLRRHKHVAGSLDDEGFVTSKPARNQGDPGYCREIDGRRYIEQFLLAFQEDRKLTELIVATQATDGSHNSNQQLAGLLETTERDIVNRKRRILRKLPWTLWPRRGGSKTL
jgi:DNA-directed RNA polymerase specialized sigma24 family protein